MALAAVLAVVHCRHEDTSTALSAISIKTHHPAQEKITGETHLRRRALPPQPLNLPIAIHLVVLEHCQLDLLALVLDLLGRGVDLLLTLFTAAT